MFWSSVDLTGNQTASLYGRLRELADDDFDSPYQVDACANAVSTAAGIIRAYGLEVVADPSDYTLSAPWVFGTSGGTEDQVDSKLAAVNKLLDAAGFNSATTFWSSVDLTGNQTRHTDSDTREPSELNFTPKAFLPSAGASSLSITPRPNPFS